MYDWPLLARRVGPPRLIEINIGENDITSSGTPGSPVDADDKTGTLPTFILTTFKEPFARHNRSTAQSGTGLDGPLSSESDKLSKLLRDGLSDLKESTSSANVSNGSQKPKSNTSGSIDWEKNWEKRKPRRKHDVSEAVNPDFTRPLRPVDLSSAASGSKSEDESDGKSCSYLSQHDVQFHALKRYAANSCPELHRQLDEFDKSFAKLQTRDSEQPISQVRFDLTKDPHRRHFHVRNIVTKQFRSLGRKLQRTGSSTFSIRSDFPAPPDSRRRRLLARDSADIWPSSGNETPLFNTPESNISSVNMVGNYLDPLAMASMVIATAELDRLSSRASLDQASRKSGSSTGFSHASPTSPTPLYSGSASPNNGASLSNSTTLDVPPTNPFNTPASSSSQSGVASPTSSSRSPQRRGHRRRGQRSHLSEVATPDEVASPAEPAEDFGERRLSFSSPQIETLPECSATHPCENENESENENERGMYPKPLAINRGGYKETEPRIGSSSEDKRKSSIPSVSVSPPEEHGSFLRSLSGFSDTEEAISPPSRVSSIGKTPESMYSTMVTDSVRGQPFSSSLFGPGRTGTSLSTIPDADSSARLTAALSFKELGSAAAPANDTSARNVQAVSEEPVDSSAGHPNTDSCHPCTWSESQGEPGNSDPFCPPDCLETRHSSQDSHRQPSGSMREGSVETIYTVVVTKGAESSSDDSADSTEEGKGKKANVP
ncbi:Phosphatidylinositol-4-phosphate 5-kinase [Hypoxylon texense]